MEQNAIQWVGAPCCARGSYAFYRSVGSREQPEGPLLLWRLGAFYWVRCSPTDPVCIAEVTLLWEDQVQRHLLASLRLYFLPEDTPRGRSREHGEDEVLAVSKKVVFRVEDLVKWTCAHPAGWGRNSSPLRDKTDNISHQPQGGVRVLSYPQYCRFRCLQKRVQSGQWASPAPPGPLEAHLQALGGLKGAPLGTRVMYCRDTFSHPALEHSSLWTHFRCPSLSLRGRPRKRKSGDGKESPTPSQSESWIERMKENVMGSVELGGEDSWLPHPDEQLFLDQLFSFMEGQGTPISKVPNLGFKKINLFLMYSVVQRLGGYDKVTSDRLWKVVYNELGGCPGSTSAATCTRRHYERLMLLYEEHIRAGGAELKLPESLAASRVRGIKGRRQFPRGRRPKKTTPPTPAPPAPSPGVVAQKRGRGRPPGRRNKATLIAQAKLMAQQQAKARAAHYTPEPPQGPPTPHHPQGAHQGLQEPKQELQYAPNQSLQGPNQDPQAPLQGLQAPLQGPHQSPHLDLQEPKQELHQGPHLDILPHQLQQLQQQSPPVAPPSLPLTPDLSPLSGPLPPFSPTSRGPPTLDVFRSRLGLPPPPPPASGGGARGLWPPLPPLRVLPLDLGCGESVRRLMRAPLGPAHLASFARRLTEVLTQDAPPPGAPATPPPEQATPLNLSKRSPPPLQAPAPKRPRGEEGEGPADLSSPSRARASLGGVAPPLPSPEAPPPLGGERGVGSEVMEEEQDKGMAPAVSRETLGFDGQEARAPPRPPALAQHS